VPLWGKAKKKERQYRPEPHSGASEMMDIFIEGIVMERLIGSSYSWNERGYALIFVTPQQRFFMHISQFQSDHLPTVGETVSFSVAPPRKLGQLPCAVNVKPVETSTEVKQ
jgi:hypothetical protein